MRLTGYHSNLEDYILLFPTPRASDADRGGRGELLHMAKGAETPRGPLWPTPSAEKLTPNTKDTDDLVNAAGEPLQPGEKPHDRRTGKPVQTALTDMVRLWPTPNSADADRGPDDRDRPGSGGPNLLSAVKTRWPTPTSRDHKDTGDCANVPENALPGRAVQPSKVEGSLEPGFVEWLQGYPLGWTLDEMDGRVPDWSAEWPDVPRVSKGAPHRVARLRALGNAVVPACVAYVMRWWMTGEDGARPVIYTEPVPVEARLLEVKFFRGNAVQAWCHDHLGHGHPVKEIYPWYSNARKVMRMNPRVIINAENAGDTVPYDATHIAWLTPVERTGP